MDANVVSAIKVTKTLSDISSLCEDWSKTLEDSKESFRKLNSITEDIQNFNEQFDDLPASDIEGLRERHTYTQELSLTNELRKLRKKLTELESIAKNVSKKRSDFLSVLKSQQGLDVTSTTSYDGPTLAEVLDLMAECQTTLEEEICFRKVLIMEDDIANSENAWLDDSTVYELQEKLSDLLCSLEQI